MATLFLCVKIDPLLPSTSPPLSSPHLSSTLLPSPPLHFRPISLPLPFPPPPPSLPPFFPTSSHSRPYLKCPTLEWTGPVTPWQQGPQKGGTAHTSHSGCVPSAHSHRCVTASSRCEQSGRQSSSESRGTPDMHTSRERDQDTMPHRKAFPTGTLARAHTHTRVRTHTPIAIRQSIQ